MGAVGGHAHSTSGCVYYVLHIPAHSAGGDTGLHTGRGRACNQLTLERQSLAAGWLPGARWYGVGKLCFASSQRRISERLGAKQRRVVGVQE